MKIENVGKVLDPVTYEPRITFTGSFSLETLLDQHLLQGGKIQQIVGAEFLLQLENGLRQFNTNLKEVK